VIVGSGAEIQGAVVVSDNVRVASGSIVMRDVPPDSIVVGVPGRVIYREGKRVEDKPPDIEAEALKSMKLRIDEMERRLESLAHQSSGEGEPYDRDEHATPRTESDDISALSGDMLEDPVEVFLHGAGI
jgi:serine O-acetyltransferase